MKKRAPQPRDDRPLRERLGVDQPAEEPVNALPCPDCSGQGYTRGGYGQKFCYACTGTGRAQ